MEVKNCLRTTNDQYLISTVWTRKQLKEIGWNGEKRFSPKEDTEDKSVYLNKVHMD